MFGALQACRGTLRSLELKWVGSLALGPWLRGFSSLTELKLASDIEVCLESGLERLPSLQLLDINWSPYARVTSLPVSLTCLGLFTGEAEFVSSDSLQTLQALKELEVDGISQADSVLSSLSALSGLTQLNLSRCGLRAMPSQLTTLTMLRRLYFEGAQVSGQQLEVLRSLRNLEVVSFCECNLDALPTMLSSLRKLRSLFAHKNPRIPSLAGSWLGRVKVLSLDLSCLCHCVGQLDAAKLLKVLYVARAGQPSEQSCKGLATALQALPALQTVKYVRTRSPGGSDMRENFAFVQLLLELSSGGEVKVQAIEEEDVEWQG